MDVWQTQSLPFTLGSGGLPKIVSPIVSGPQGPETQSFLATGARHSRGIPCVGCTCLLAVVEWCDGPGNLVRLTDQACKGKVHPPELESRWGCKNGACSAWRVPAGSCLSGRCFKINKSVSFTYGLGAFQIVAFDWVLGGVGLYVNTLRVDFLFPLALQLS